LQQRAALGPRARFFDGGDGGKSAPVANAREDQSKVLDKLLHCHAPFPVWPLNSRDVQGAWSCRLELTYLGVGSPHAPS
jgi:hypothetical protein